MSEELLVDLFAGAGGASQGIEAALEQPITVAVNHSPVALAVHARNHPRTVHLVEDVRNVRPRELTRGRRVGVLWASPDCTQYSRAKGGKPKSRGLRSLAEVVITWAEEVRPRVIFVENVAEFLDWGPLDANDRPIPERSGELFHRWRVRLELLGYQVEYRILCAAHYGAPTSRRRLFIVARRDGQPIRWPEPTHGPGLLPYRTAAECIDWSIPAPSIFERKRPLVPNTLRRIAAGLRKFVLEDPNPFVVDLGGRTAAPVLIQTGYGEREGQAPRVLDLHQPMGTLVAGGVKQGLVMAFLAKHYGGNSTPGSSLRAPMDTITTQDHHALVTARLGGAPDRREEVRGYLMAYYGQGVGQSLHEPLRTIVSRDRFGLVLVNGYKHVITDICMRMLVADELKRGQFGRFAGGYDLSPARTHAAQVRLIGNSVPPEMAEALVAANLGRGEGRVAA